MQIMMDQLIDHFPQQLKEALEIARNLSLAPIENEIHEIVISGMGGSGIGGDFVRHIVWDECLVPVFVIKGYEFPAFGDKNTLVIVSSYSGNTEETIAVMEKAMEATCYIVCLSSGGKIQELAEKNKIPFIAVPAGSPSPRACLGYSIVLQLAVLHQYGLITSSIPDSFLIASDLIKFEKDEIKSKAKTIAGQLEGKIAVLYTTNMFEPVAVRLRQQLNENSKVLCWHHTFPEMNHNELVGWVDKTQLAVIFLRNKDDNKRNIKRMDISKDIIAGKTNTIIEVYSKGQNRVEKMIYMIHLADWISYFLASFRKVDVMEVNVINNLKYALEKDSLM
jgi:glucose/mannose-6-phosphate isomerase